MQYTLCDNDAERKFEQPDRQYGDRGAVTIFTPSPISDRASAVSTSPATPVTIQTASGGPSIDLRHYSLK
jgi:hypothetical protein